MPLFRTTKDIFVDNTDYFDENWYDKKYPYPPNPKWDNKRELKIEDIDIWEVIAEQGPSGVYAAWCPYAEFYMIIINRKVDSTYYGKDSDKHAAKRLDEIGIKYPRKNDTMGVR
jgi:hypothetical protein